MRPIRVMSRNNSIQKNNINVESRLISSLSKNMQSNYINYDKDSIANRATDKIKLFELQATNFKSQTSAFSGNKDGEFHRINLTPSQALQQKQGIIQHFKLELQQSKYIVMSLKQQNKQLLSQLKSISVGQDRRNMNKQNQRQGENSQEKDKDKIDLKKQEDLITQMNKQLDFLKDKQLKDKWFIQMYQQLIQKLRVKVQSLQQQNLMLRTRPLGQSQQCQLSDQQEPQTKQQYSNFALDSQLEVDLKLGKAYCKNTFGNTQILTDTHRGINGFRQLQTNQIKIQSQINQGRQYLFLKQNKNFNNLNSNLLSSAGKQDRIKKHSGQIQMNLKAKQSNKIQKENHPSTPKNNLPLSLKKQMSFDKIRDKQNQTHASTQQMQNVIPEQTIDQKSRRVNFSPYKLKQRVINSRRNSHAQQQKPSDQSYCSSIRSSRPRESQAEKNCANVLDLMVSPNPNLKSNINRKNKLDKKIYF